MMSHDRVRHVTLDTRPSLVFLRATLKTEAGPGDEASGHTPRVYGIMTISGTCTYGVMVHYHFYSLGHYS